MKKPNPFQRRRPDFFAGELIAVLSEHVWFEFKPLFILVHKKLRDRNAANGGQEMLRLRSYEKLQNLVQVGGVEKNGKSYRGIAAGLASITGHLAAEHCRDLLSAAKEVTPPPTN